MRRPVTMDQLAQHVAQATGLTEALAQIVLETARERIDTIRPDLAERVETMLVDPERAARVVAWIARWGARLDPRGGPDDGRAEEAPAQGTLDAWCSVPEHLK